MICRSYADVYSRLTQQTQNICIALVQRRPNVFDVGPTLYKCYTNVSCLLGTAQSSLRTSYDHQGKPNNTRMERKAH